MSVVGNLEMFLDSVNATFDSAYQVAHSGEIYFRREFASSFHERLDIELMDPEKAQRIFNSYEKNLFPHLLAEERRVFEDWVIKNVRYMGAIPFHSQWRGELESSINGIFKTYTHHISLFFQEIQEGETPCSFPVIRDPRHPKNVVIITTTGGGGHKSVADAIRQILQRFPERYNVIVIDVKDVFKSSDALYQLSGMMCSEEVYDKVYQQLGQIELARRLWEMKARLNLFIPNTGMRDLKERVRLLQPDIIISSCHFLDRDLELSAALGLPLRFVHCDYELSWGLLSLIPKVNPQIVKLWLPANDPETLRPTSTQLKSELVQQLRLTHSDEEIDRLIEERSKAVIDYSGYPVRSSFVRETDPAVLQGIRERFQVQDGVQVVVLQMGRQGVGTLQSTVRILNEDRTVVYERPLHLAVMCGTNVAMREALLQYFEENEQHPQINFVLLPLMDQQDTADYLKIADAEIMKSGGAATGEALELAVNTLIYMDSTHPWEGCNRDQMVRHGIGTVVETLQTIPAQLKEVLAKPRNTSYIPIAAHVAIPKLVDEAVTVFEKFIQVHSAEEKRGILTDAIFERTPVADTALIYHMLDLLHVILTRHEIDYWMNGGTLLGAIRHAGIIPWDDDGDIQIFEKDVEKLLSLRGEFAIHGFELVEHELCLKLWRHHDKYPSIDIFSARESPETGRYYIGNPQAKELWPNDYWTGKELSKIVPYVFGSQILMGCDNTERYLATLYGADYMTTAYRIWNHLENRMHARVEVMILDRNPAPWHVSDGAPSSSSSSAVSGSSSGPSSSSSSSAVSSSMVTRL